MAVPGTLGAWRSCMTRPRRKLEYYVYIQDFFKRSACGFLAEGQKTTPWRGNAARFATRRAAEVALAATGARRSVDAFRIGGRTAFVVELDPLQGVQ